MAKSDQAQIASVVEVTIGTTPATPPFVLVRALSDSLAHEANVVESAELINAPGITDQSRGGINVVGGIVMPMAYNNVLDDYMRSILGDNLGWIEGGQAVPSFTKRGFTIEKGYIDELGTRRYHRFVGTAPSSIEIGYEPQNPVQATVNFVGGRFVVDDAAIAGATYDAPTPPVDAAKQMRSAKVTPVWGGTLAAMNGWCHTALSIQIDRKNTARACIGRENAEEFELGTLKCTINATILYGGNVAQLAHLADEEFSLVVTMLDDGVSPAQHTYEFTFARVKLLQTPVVTPGKGNDVVVNLTAEALQPQAGDVVAILRDTI